ncbi:MAG: hypothetical protein KAR42_03770 [candidate division Zixibacteria bacterium]|nr:hypothetical protein [candidate division Zixibacteria bacterium]
MRHSRCTIFGYVFITIIFCLISFGCSDDDKSTPAGPSGSWDWEAVGTGVNDRIFALAEFNGDLYVGGFFDSAGGIAVSNFALWNDSVWEKPLILQVNNEVAALCVFDGKITAGGNFSYPFSYHLFWDGATVSANTGSPNGRIYALCVFDDSLLIVAGDFDEVGSGTVANNIASFQFLSGGGGQWSALGTGTDGPVYSLAVHDGKLYAGGHFVHAGGATVNNVAVWHDSVGVWGSLLTGVSYDADTAHCIVDALESFNNRLYVGGLFSTAGSTSVNNIASYTLSGWQACGTGTHNVANGHIKDLTVFDNKLIAGGYFSSMGGVSNTTRIAAWDGTSWSALGEGVNGDYWPHVWGMCEYRNELYVGGRFTIAGTDSTVGNVACWSYTPD